MASAYLDSSSESSPSSSSLGGLIISLFWEEDFRADFREDFREDFLERDLVRDLEPGLEWLPLADSFRDALFRDALLDRGEADPREDDLPVRKDDPREESDSDVIDDRLSLRLAFLKVTALLERWP